jgi:hypothetical protein
MTCFVYIAVDLEVVSAETVPVRMFSGNQYGNHEVTYTWNRGEQKEFWLLILRIYVSGGGGYLGDGIMPNDRLQQQSAAAAAYGNAISGRSNDTSASDDRTVCCTIS